MEGSQGNFNKPRPQHRFLVTITGCAASGKTTIAVLLQQIFGFVVIHDRPITVDFLCQDNYFRPAEKCPQAIFSDPTEQHVLYGPHGMMVTKVHSDRPFGVQVTGSSITTYRYPNSNNLGKQHQWHDVPQTQSQLKQVELTIGIY